VKKLLFLSPLLFLFSFAWAQPKIKVMQFQNGKFKYIPSGYLISNVVDDRADTSNIGFVKLGVSDKPATLKLYGGTANAVNQLLINQMRQDRSAFPIELHISKLDVSEKRSGGMDKAEVEIAYTFYVNGEKTIQLTASGSIKSGLDATQYIEQIIRQQTESALKQFGEWWAENKKDYISGPSVTVKVSVDNKPRDKDYIPWSSGRPLIFSDFEGTPDDLSTGAAGTASAVSMGVGSLTRGKQVELEIKIGAMFDKKHSWFKKDAHDPRILAHEQLHFSITTYMACELIHTIRSYKFSFDNYEDELMDIKKKNEQDTEAMQNQYDRESTHGVNQKVQKEWSDRVSQLLREQDCFN
jgi:hypothetical protein